MFEHKEEKNTNKQILLLLLKSREGTNTGNYQLLKQENGKQQRKGTIINFLFGKLLFV